MRVFTKNNMTKLLQENRFTRQESVRHNIGHCTTVVTLSNLMKLLSQHVFLLLLFQKLHQNLGGVLLFEKQIFLKKYHNIIFDQVTSVHLCVLIYYPFETEKPTPVMVSCFQKKLGKTGREMKLHAT